MRLSKSIKILQLCVVWGLSVCASITERKNICCTNNPSHSDASLRNPPAQTCTHLHTYNNIWCVYQVTQKHVMRQVCVARAASFHVSFARDYLAVLSPNTKKIKAHWTGSYRHNYISTQFPQDMRNNHNIPCSCLAPGMITSYIILQTASEAQLGMCGSPICTLPASPPQRFQLMTPLFKSRQKILPLLKDTSINYPRKIPLILYQGLSE